MESPIPFPFPGCDEKSVSCHGTSPPADLSDLQTAHFLSLPVVSGFVPHLVLLHGFLCGIFLLV